MAIKDLPSPPTWSKHNARSRRQRAAPAAAGAAGRRAPVATALTGSTRGRRRRVLPRVGSCWRARRVQQ